jgi:hypothetical protein
MWTRTPKGWGKHKSTREIKAKKGTKEFFKLEIRTRDMTQVVACPPSKGPALSSSPRATNKKTNKKAWKLDKEITNLKLRKQADCVS